MKQIAMIAAAGSLAAFAAPASAAPITPSPDAFAGTGWSLDPTARIGLAALLHDPDRWDDDDRWDEDDWRDRRDFRRGRGRGFHDRRGRYIEPRRIGRRDRVWRGRDGRYYCERDDGTTGLVIGAGVGALLGRTIDTRGDRTLGTLLGGALGAVLGREIDRGELRCR